VSDRECGFDDMRLLGPDADGEVAAHLEACPACRVRRTEYLGIESLLGGLPMHAAPPRPAGRLRTPRFRRPSPWWLVSVPVVAAAAAMTIWWLSHGKLRDEISLFVELEHVGTAVRGDQAHIGDVLHATTQGRGHHAVWIYRNDHELVFACPGSLECRETHDGLTADVTVRANGNYAIVGLSSRAAIDPPRGSLDDEVGRAVAAGAKYRIHMIEAR
jgi:hypothetical protein